MAVLLLKKASIYRCTLKECVHSSIGSLLLQCIAFLHVGILHAESLSDEEFIQRRTIDRALQDEAARAEKQARQRRQPVSGSDFGINEADLSFGKASDSDICFVVEEFVFSGASSAMNKLLEKRLLPEFQGECLAEKDIETILKQANSAYLEKGFITSRVYIPEQDLHSRQLELLIEEGKIEAITVKDPEQQAIYLPTIFPAGEGDVLNLRDIEQGLEQLNRLQSVQATMDIVPGESSGNSIVLIDNKVSKVWNLNLSMDDYGSESTGKEQTAINLSLDNLLGIHEFWSLTWRQAVPSDRKNHFSSFATFNIEVPYGYSTFSYTHTHSEHNNRLPTENRSLSEGVRVNEGLSWKRNWYRDQLSRYGSYVTFARKDVKSYLDLQFVEANSRSLSVLSLGVTGDSSLWGAKYDFDGSWVVGTRLAGADKDLEHLPADSPRAQFRKAALKLNIHRPFKIADLSFNWKAELSGQYAFDTLHGGEQIGIGGIYSVRGYSENGLSGDHGYYWRNEVNFQHSLYDFQLNIYGLLDFGQVWQYAGTDSDSDGGMVGAGFGVRSSIKEVSVSMELAAPLLFPGRFEREKPSFNFRLSKNW